MSYFNGFHTTLSQPVALWKGMASRMAVAMPVLLIAILLVALTDQRVTADDSGRSGKIPVIYDSDIGDDIDDTWAFCLLLKSPECDVKLVVGDQGKSAYRAKLFAKLLQVAKRTDIPIGIGLDVNAKGNGNQQDWVAGYQLESYPGKIIEDGVQAIIDTIMKSPEPVTVIAVGPLPNIKAALEREPRIAQKARFVGMHGSVRLGYGGNKTPAPEYNVRADAPACQAALSAPWDVTITPLDTCGLVHLRGRMATMRQLLIGRSLAKLVNCCPGSVNSSFRKWKTSQIAPSERLSRTLFV